MKAEGVLSARYWDGFVKKLQSAAMAAAILDSLVVWFVNPEKSLYRNLRAEILRNTAGLDDERSQTDS